MAALWKGMEPHQMAALQCDHCLQGGRASSCVTVYFQYGNALSTVSFEMECIKKKNLSIYN